MPIAAGGVSQFGSSLIAATRNPQSVRLPVLGPDISFPLIVNNRVVIPLRPVYASCSSQPSLREGYAAVVLALDALLAVALSACQQGTFEQFEPFHPRNRIRTDF